MSYASEIENRVIHNNWNSYSRKVGRLTMRAITKQVEDRYWGHRIGSEVVWNNTHGNDWIFRSYVDGLAFFRPNQLTRFNYPTETSIKSMIMKHFNVIKTTIDNDHRSYNTRTMHVLRRKPCSDATRNLMDMNAGFTGFMLTKYNIGGGNNDE